MRIVVTHLRQQWHALAATFVLEHGGIASITSTQRFIAALPLGAAVAWVVVRAARGPHAAIE